LTTGSSRRANTAEAKSVMKIKLNEKRIPARIRSTNP
jgi:hypothetical protein